MTDPVRSPASTCFRFGAFELNAITGELRKGGVLLKLQPQPFRVLLLLVERCGQLVTREEIQRRLWSGSTFVDFEHGINFSINKIRVALADDADKPRYVETLPRRGYRWIFPMEPAETTGIHLPARPYRNIFVVTGVLALAVGVFLVLHRNRGPKLTEKDTVVLAEFVNSTNDPVFDGALTQALSADLEQSPFLNIFSQENMRQSLAYMRRSPDEHVTGPVAREICERNGIKALIGGEIFQIGTQYVLNVIATNCLTGDTLAHEQAEAKSKEQVLPALSDAARKIRAALGESLGSIKKFDAPIYQATTSSLEALQAYTLGEETRARENDLAAIPFYQRAIEIDPEFVYAYALLGTIYQNTGDHPRTVEYQTKAFERRNHTSQLERFYITARYYGDVTGEVEKEIATYELWRETYPRDYTPIANLGETYRVLGDPERGLTFAMEALKLEPYDGIVYEQATSAFAQLNRFEEAKSVARAALTRGIDAIDLHTDLYGIAFAEHDTTEMKRQVDWARGKLEEWQMLHFQALVAGSRGRVREFRRLSQQAFEGALRQKSTGFAARYAGIRASEEAVFGYPDEARRWATEALKLSQNELGWIPAVLAQAGDSARAEKIASSLAKRRPTDTLLNERDLPQVRAAILISRGNGAAAVAALQPSQRFAKTTVAPVYLRGLAYLLQRQGKEAEMEFSQIVTRAGVLPIALEHSMAHLGLARAYALQNDNVRACEAYGEFRTLWEDADPEVPTLKQAKAEYVKLCTN
jgi:DNA-binding winged helix-turn-helix (wHTH) protein/tetratricopeptide (TPR) repeat protein